MSYKSESFKVGWLCAIEPEFVIACELLDQEYSREERPPIHEQDQNSYSFGRIHEHNVVIACLPKGQYGTNSASLVASHMLLSFPSIRIGLMVGIGGGAPSSKRDIRLGDVVVSAPTPRHGGVIQYDYGKAVQNQEFDETGYLATPPKALLSAVAYLSAQHRRKGHQIAETISAVLAKNKRLKNYYCRPPADCDELYLSSYTHSEDCLCQSFNRTDSETSRSLDCVKQRNKRGDDEDDPAIHYGLIASANTLLKDATIRDRLVKKHDVLCFEMEAAGLMDSFPCIVIRGVSDYADSHKRDQWQSYAAATAAAYAKELLGVISGTEVRTIQPVSPIHVLQSQTSSLTIDDSKSSTPDDSLMPTSLQDSRIIEQPAAISIADDAPERVRSLRKALEALKLPEEIIFDALHEQELISKDEQSEPSSIEEDKSNLVDYEECLEENSSIHKTLWRRPILVTVDQFLDDKEVGRTGLYEIDIMSVRNMTQILQIRVYLQHKLFDYARLHCRDFLRNTNSDTQQERIERLLLQCELGNAYFFKDDMSNAAYNYGTVWQTFPGKSLCAQAIYAKGMHAQAMVRLGDDKLAMETFEDVLHIVEKFHGICHPNATIMMEHLVKLYSARRLPVSASVLYKKLWYARYMVSGKIEHPALINLLEYSLDKSDNSREYKRLKFDSTRYFMNVIMPEYGPKQYE